MVRGGAGHLVEVKLWRMQCTVSAGTVASTAGKQTGRISSASPAIRDGILGRRSKRLERRHRRDHVAEVGYDAANRS